MKARKAKRRVGSWQLQQELNIVRNGERGLGAAFYKMLDPGIRHEVQILAENGVETFESCQGGKGHCYPEPTVRFAASGNVKAGALIAAEIDRLERVAAPRSSEDESKRST